MLGGTGWFGATLLSVVYLAIAAFIFGIIFWWTYRLVNPERRKHR